MGDNDENFQTRAWEVGVHNFLIHRRLQVSTSSIDDQEAGRTPCHHLCRITLPIINDLEAGVADEKTRLHTIHSSEHLSRDQHLAALSDRVTGENKYHQQHEQFFHIHLHLHHRHLVHTALFHT